MTCVRFPVSKLGHYIEGFHDSHVGGLKKMKQFCMKIDLIPHRRKNGDVSYRGFSRQPCWRAVTMKEFCMKIGPISQGKENVLFLPSNLAAMASHENALIPYSPSLISSTNLHIALL